MKKDLQRSVLDINRFDIHACPLFLIMFLYQMEGETICATHWNPNRVSCSSLLGGVSADLATCWYCWRSFSVGTSGDDVAGRDSGGLSFITSIGWVSRLSAAGFSIFRCSVPARVFFGISTYTWKVGWQGLYNHSMETLYDILYETL